MCQHSGHCHAVSETYTCACFFRWSCRAMRASDGSFANAGNKNWGDMNDGSLNVGNRNTRSGLFGDNDVPASTWYWPF